MRHISLIDMSVGEIMARWPGTIRLFLARRMHCVGCPISPFHTLADAATEHGLDGAALLAAIEAEVDAARMSPL